MILESHLVDNLWLVESNMEGKAMGLPPSRKVDY